MKNLLIAVLLLCPLTVAADDYAYDGGSYWTVTGVDTEPGRFDDYLSDLSKVWRKSLQMMMDDGKVLSYKVFANVNNRADEPDLWLMVEWKSAGEMLDTPRDYFDENSKKIFGSMEKGKKANDERGKIRTIGSNSLLRELNFK